ncbi:MAG TPA: hypothetical protein VFO40_28570 [Chthoniobacterales bacterium]|nr:hypothetical protein [Chthoniobacterales bacterium]
MPPVYFPIVSNTVDHQLKTNQLFAPIIDQQAYTGPLAFLLLAWLAASVVTAILLLALFLPGHLGLTDWLRAADGLLPTDPPSYTT